MSQGHTNMGHGGTTHVGMVVGGIHWPSIIYMSPDPSH
jgi:hypothetical protein